MIELIEGLPANVIGIAVKGRVTQQECREILTPAIEKSLRWRNKIRLYNELGSRFPGAGWDDLDIGFEHAARCERIAIVTDTAWVRLTIKAIRFLIPGKIRVFATDEASAARNWVTARPELLVDTDDAVPVPTRGVRAPRAVRPSPRWGRQTASARRQIAKAGPVYAEPE